MKYKDRGMDIVVMFSSLGTPTPRAASRVVKNTLKAVGHWGNFLLKAPTHDLRVMHFLFLPLVL